MCADFAVTARHGDLLLAAAGGAAVLSWTPAPYLAHLLKAHKTKG